MSNNFDIKDSKTLIATFVVLFVLIAIPLTVISVVNTRDTRSKAAGTATIYISPASQTYNVNNNIDIQIRENSGTTPVTTVDASLSYDATKMDFLSIDAASTSDFQSDATTPSGGNGTVSLVRFVPQIDGQPAQSVTGDRLVATIHFKAKTVPVTGTQINFTNGVVYETSDGANIAGTPTGATYNIVDPPPTVSVVAPSNGALVNGSSLLVQANATDNLGVSKVDFYLDANSTPTSTQTTPASGSTYQFALNTTTLTNAAHTIKAVATDTNGGTTSSQISVTVDNAAPTVSITAPANNQKINKTVTVTASASDNRSIARVDFYLDNGVSPINSDTTSPYSFSWDTTTTTSANHTLKAVATDGLNSTTSSSITVTVDNQPPTTPTLSGTAISQTQINLSWTASTDTQGTVTYDVYRNSTKLTTTPITTTTYSDTGLTSSTSYTYFIRVTDQIGNTTDSNSLPISTLAPWKVGDINHDNLVNSADLAILLATWASTTDLRADLNNDGRITSADLAILLSRWGT